MLSSGVERIHRSTGLWEPGHSADRPEPAGPVLRCPNNFRVQKAIREGLGLLTNIYHPTGNHNITYIDSNSNHIIIL